MWWRSWFLQSAWSYEFKQNLGFAAAFRRLRPGSRIPAARLLEPFNTNPATFCFVLPFLATQEAGGADEEAFLRARAFLASSFAATGDRLVWFLLRPAAGRVKMSACLMPSSSLPACAPLGRRCGTCTRLAGSSVGS